MIHVISVNLFQQLVRTRIQDPNRKSALLKMKKNRLIEELILFDEDEDDENDDVDDPHQLYSSDDEHGMWSDEDLDSDDVSDDNSIISETDSEDSN